MNTPKVGKVGVALIAFCMGVGTCFLVPRLLRKMVDQGGTEEARVTSPGGRFDAVMVREAYGGGAGGFLWYVFIVPKGKTAPSDQSFPIFRAGTLTGEKLSWEQPHLLEIHYDVAEIEEFRNLWGIYEVQRVDPEREDPFVVEVKLVPSTPDFSLLTPDGTYRPH